MTGHLLRRDAEAAALAEDTPLLRTLLLTDLCDSTEIVEKIGDAASAQLFRQHDQRVLELQQRWRGRLIDRSDGLLLLFERPVDGLGFALDYIKALKPLGKANALPLRARVGLHVGEVLAWRNSVEAVQQGAKSMEVEGLAKPMAARLMALARADQILLSPVAEALVRRASRELGARGEQLLWKSHGRWQFKGVPGAQEIHEVGEAGIAPLRMPKNGPKAWRDLPFWRRPASLVAEAALLAMIGVGAWFFFKPEPAIAFAERDWVVVGDMRNLTGDQRLDESLEQAFRISLEQSRYVNVLSDLKARETLQRMQKPASTALDRAIASEIALRDGARAVILPTVSEVGGRLRVSAEVVDPSTQATVYAETADGRGMGSALDSVDDVTGALRVKLGEAMAVIQRDSKPLPQVTSSNIDALKAYALGQQAFGRADYKQAKDWYTTATEADPHFALAHIGILRSFNAMGNHQGGIPHLAKAHEDISRLTTRDQFHVRGWLARIHDPNAEGKVWMQMSEQYPDDFPAAMNAAMMLWERNAFKEGLRYLKRALDPRNTSFEQAKVIEGHLLLGTGRTKQAIAAYQIGEKYGLDSARLGLVRAYAQAKNFTVAKSYLDRVKKQTGDGITFERVTLALDAGNALEAYREAVRLSNTRGMGNSRRQAVSFVLAVAAHANGNAVESRRALMRASELASSKAAQASDAYSRSEMAYITLQAAIFSKLIGHKDLANALESSAKKLIEFSAYPELSALSDWLSSNSTNFGELPIRLSGKPHDDLAPFITRFHAGPQNPGGRKEMQSESLQRAVLYAELGCGWCQQPASVYLISKVK